MNQVMLTAITGGHGIAQQTATAPVAGPSRACLRRLSSLLQLERGGLLGVVDELEHEPPARPGPALVRLPRVDVLAAGRVVDQARPARRRGRARRADRGARRAVDRDRFRIAAREDVQPAVSAEAELDWDDGPRLRGVQGGVADRD